MTNLNKLCLALPLFALGCEAPELPPAAQAPAPAVTEQPKEAVVMVAGAPGKELPETEVPVTDIPRKFRADDPIQGRRSRREASEGTNVLGIGSTVAGTMYAKHQMLIHAIDSGNQIYWGRNNLEYAKTQEEFIKEVVDLALNGVPLPKLEEDHEYCYVPEQPEVGLQIRLKPGSPRSKVPAGTSPQEAMKLLGVDINAEPAAPPRSQQWSSESNSDESSVQEPADDEPTYDIRTRAAEIGKAGNDKIESGAGDE